MKTKKRIQFFVSAKLYDDIDTRTGMMGIDKQEVYFETFKAGLWALSDRRIQRKYIDFLIKMEGGK